jgi:hypothetical protein
MADETKRAPVSDEVRPDEERGQDVGDDEPLDLPQREAMSIIGPDTPVGGVTLYPDVNLDPLRGPDPSA